jgi:hypothetical protein
VAKRRGVIVRWVRRKITYGSVQSFSHLSNDVGRVKRDPFSISSVPVSAIHWRSIARFFESLSLDCPTCSLGPSYPMSVLPA